jgi:hypothetical protein
MSAARTFFPGKRAAHELIARATTRLRYALKMAKSSEGVQARNLAIFDSQPYAGSASEPVERLVGVAGTATHIIRHSCKSRFRTCSSSLGVA